MPRGRKAEPFENCYKINSISGCWEWQKYLAGMGYGKRGHKGKVILAHRFSWMLHCGVIPNGMQVLHDCDNPSCVNPAHLFLGTNDDNVKDKVKKGRQHRPKGELNGRARLTKNQILAIRADTREKREIAHDYGMNSGQINEIKLRKTWKHI